MSQKLLEFAKTFICGDVNVEEFVDKFMDGYKCERDNGTWKQDNEKVEECLSTMFCLADLYSPPETREYYELGEEELRSKMLETLKEFNLS